MNRSPVVLLYVPLVEELTLIPKVQVPFPAIVAPLSEITRVVASVVTVPPHCEVDDVATVNPAGKVSVKLTLEIEAVPGLVIVNVSVEDPPARIVLGENDLARLALMILA